MEINMRMIGKIWSKLRRNNDNRGMSLVEILCAVAIFSVVAATVSGIVIVSSRLYNKGVTQTSLQQEAQYIANQVGYIIKGANQIDANSSMGGYSGIKVVTMFFFIVPKLTEAVPSFTSTTSPGIATHI